MIALVKIRLLDYDSDYSLRGETLQKAIEEDIQKGLIPFYVSWRGLLFEKNAIHIHGSPF